MIEKCPICLIELLPEMSNVEFDGNYRICSLNCKHQFHCECIYNLVMSKKNKLDVKCPLCRTDIESIMVYSNYKLHNFINAKINYDYYNYNRKHNLHNQTTNSNRLDNVTIIVIFIFSYVIGRLLMELYFVIINNVYSILK